MKSAALMPLTRNRRERGDRSSGEGHGASRVEIVPSTIFFAAAKVFFSFFSKNRKKRRPIYSATGNKFTRDLQYLYNSWPPTGPPKNITSSELMQQNECTSFAVSEHPADIGPHVLTLVAKHMKWHCIYSDIWRAIPTRICGHSSSVRAAYQGVVRPRIDYRERRIALFFFGQKKEDRLFAVGARI
jgi:hypothetical protein